MKKNAKTPRFNEAFFAHTYVSQIVMPYCEGYTTRVMPLMRSRSQAPTSSTGC